MCGASDIKRLDQGLRPSTSFVVGLDRVVPTALKIVAATCEGCGATWEEETLA